MRRLALTLTLIVPLTACGSSGSSGDYGAALDEVCTATDAFSQDLVAQVRAGDLTTAQAQQMATARAAENRQQVAAITPPQDLADEAKKLTEDSANTPTSAGTDPAVVRDYLTTLRDDYTAVGADGCAAIVSRGLDR